MLHIHRSERADGLVAMLGDLLAVPVLDPMTPEVVAVPTRGIERWLTQQLSTRLGVTPGRSDGICANVDFPFPGVLVASALASVSEVDADEDPWATNRAVWPLLEVVEEFLDESWMTPFRAHLKGASPDSEHRRFASVRHMADLFDRYAVHRPQMLRDWSKDLDGGVGIDGLWQADLWRHLRERIGVLSPAERLVDACELIRQGAEVKGIPERLSLFGLTSLPASFVDVLVALAEQREVHLFLLHPSPQLWSRVSKRLKRQKVVTLRRRDDPTVSLNSGNPLLSSWGRDSREMQLVLLAEAGDTWSDDHRPLQAPDSTLLQRVQTDVLADRRPVGSPLPGQEDGRPELDANDRSIQVHSCHGRVRQVEVLRHAILHLFEEHPDLEPRDVLVMCPDIETYAPLIHATFDADPEGHLEDGNHPDLRVRLADRAIRQINPLFGVVSRLLAMASGRVTASELLDLASFAPVRRRFGFDDEDLARMEDWIVASGIRWGLDSEHRRPFQLSGLDANTWQSGIRRILLGVSMTDAGQQLYGGVVPLDDVDSTEIELAGRLAELVDRVDTSIDELSSSKSISRWVQAITLCVQSLAKGAVGDEWQLTQLRRLMADIVDEATVDGEASHTELELGDIRSLLDDRLRGRPTRTNFRTGHLTICTLVPMRSVPHRVVCLLGLDDGEFPRSPERDGDDLILSDPRIGDHDARSEDRQLILDALLAAKDHLLITYTGRDERSNLPKPPAVPVGELLDVIDDTVRVKGGGSPSEEIVLNHPLQPFDQRNYLPGELVPSGAWSFDTANLHGARASLLRDRSALLKPFLQDPLDPLEAKAVDLGDVLSFLRSPVKAFLSQRLKMRMSDDRHEVEDSLPVVLDGLGKWNIGERILQSALNGVAVDACIAAELAKGVMPPGALSEGILEEVVPDVEALVSAGSSSKTPTSVAVNISLPSGFKVIGTIPGLRGNEIRRVTYSKMSPSMRCASWLHLLALTAEDPEHEYESVVFARCPVEGHRVSVARVKRLGSNRQERQDTAIRFLDSIVDLYVRGMREPAPLYCKTSAAWAKAALNAGNPIDAARKKWNSSYFVGGECEEDAHVLVLGGVVTVEDLFATSARSDETGQGWDLSESSRAGRWAIRLWDGLLAHEEIVER